MENKKLKIDSSVFMAIMVALLTLALLVRNEGLYPIIFADELTYSKFARLVPLSDSPLPNFLYFAIYRITNFCGDGFLGGARILNVAFFILSFPFIYATAKKFASRTSSGIVAFLTLAGTSNSYTAYFMPEALYFLSFWILIWSLVELNAESSVAKWCMCGVILGLLSLIKPHGLFLVPALLVYCVFILKQRSNNRYLHIVICTLGLTIFTVATKLAGGFILAGKNGLSLFGTFYTPYADSTMHKGSQYYWTLAKDVALNTSGHWLGLCFVYAIPVAILLHSLIRKGGRGIAQRREFSAIAVLSALIIIDLIGVTALFTATIAQESSIYYLHVRYYFFALPLLLIIAAQELESGANQGTYLTRTICAAPVIAGIVYVMATHLKPFDVISSIAPELYGLVSQPIVLYATGCIAMLSLLAWISSPRTGAKTYLFVFLPIVVVCSGFVINKDLRYRMNADMFDRAGGFAKHYLDHDQLSRTIIVGTDTDVPGLFRVLYNFDLANIDYGDLYGPNSSIKTIPRNAPFNIKDLPEKKNWILIVGDHTLSGATDSAIHGAGYSLYEVKK